MALGDSNMVNKNNNIYRPTVFGISFANLDNSAIVKSQLSVTMWNKFAKVSIGSSYNINPDNSITWDKNGEASVYLNVLNSLMLINLIDNFKNDPEKWSNHGVVSGKGLITINCGLDFDKEKDVTALRIIQFTDTERKSIHRQSAYQFKNIYKYIHEVDGGDGSFTFSNETYENLELNAFRVQLEQYVNAMTYATAYSIMDANAYNESLNKATLKEIAHSVGTRVPSITNK